MPCSVVLTMGLLALSVMQDTRALRIYPGEAVAMSQHASWSKPQLDGSCPRIPGSVESSCRYRAGPHVMIMQRLQLRGAGRSSEDEIGSTGYDSMDFDGAVGSGTQAAQAEKRDRVHPNDDSEEGSTPCRWVVLP